MKCVFCESPEIKKRTIFENGLAFVFPTNIPIVPGHVLICPKRHVAIVEELGAEELLAMADIKRKLKKALIAVFDAEGFNYAWNEGEVAGQSVPHLHLHMLPRKKGDSGIYDYEPRKFLYRPGSRERTPEDELMKVTKMLKSGHGKDDEI